MSEAHWLHVAFTSQEILRKPDKNEGVRSTAGQVIYQEGGLALPLESGEDIAKIVISSC